MQEKKTLSKKKHTISILRYVPSAMSDTCGKWVGCWGIRKRDLWTDELY